MRKAIGWVLIVLGAFLLTAGLLARFYAADGLKKTPLSVTSNTSLAGTADKLNTSTGETELLDVKVSSITKTDDKKSDDDVVVFVNTTCVVLDEPGTPECVDAGTEDDPDTRLITASTDVFATDRKTALALDAEAAADYLPDDAVEHEGLVNKWPFDVEKKDYPYWDGVMREAITAEYVGTEELDGLEVYVFSAQVEQEPATVIGDVEGLYTVERTLKIDPVTGSIISQELHDTRTLPNGDPLIELNVKYTDKEVQDNVDDAKDSGGLLRLISVTGPIIAVILGLLLVAGGFFLVLRGRSAEGQRS